MIEVLVADPLRDAPGILEIYAPFIEKTSITFETELPSVAAFGERIATYLQNYPWLICRVNGVIAGYAYASRHRERVAYQWSVESSVYIHDRFYRRRIARALYEALMEILTIQGFTNVYAVINLPNEPSVLLHESNGFHYFTTFEKVGYKLGKWKNVGWWLRRLNDYVDDPPAPIPFPTLEPAVILPVLDRAVRTIRPGRKERNKE
ncbi:MAG TPA: GNAT family N-acetyltransferase [Chitinophagaceae bacterium]|jgi:phosphinothricin acetyltransferase